MFSHHGNVRSYVVVNHGFELLDFPLFA